MPEIETTPTSETTSTTTTTTPESSAQIRVNKTIGLFKRALAEKSPDGLQILNLDEEDPLGVSVQYPDDDCAISLTVGFNYTDKNLVEVKVRDFARTEIFKDPKALAAVAFSGGKGHDTDAATATGKVYETIPLNKLSVKTFTYAATSVTKGVCRMLPKYKRGSTKNTVHPKRKAITAATNQSK